MKKNDMRWRRTERNLMDAFEKALSERPLEKISVTALSRDADINKATFYLHYRDIYDLAAAYARLKAKNAVEEMDYATEFFESPETFARHFVDDLERRRRNIDPVLESGFMPMFMEQFTASLSDRLSRLRPDLPDNPRKQVMLTFIVGGFLAAAARYAGTDKEALEDVGGSLLVGIREYAEKRFGPYSE